MKRVKEKELLKWKNSERRKPLIIRGARQVGKSWLADRLGNIHFRKYIKIDLEKRRDLHSVFDGNLDPERVLSLLELDYGRIVPGDTLLFFDEIQACPRAMTALRYFYEEMPSLHVLAAGSLLEFILKEVSVPVGRVQYLHLYPLTFHEYLLAIKKDALAEHSRRHPRDISYEIQIRLLDELRRFLVIGGMPEAVSAYADTGSLMEVFDVQSEIISSCRDDFLKYTPRVDPLCLDTVLLGAAQQVGRQIKYTKLGDRHSSTTNKKALELLMKAKIVHKIPSTSPEGLPLGARANLKKFKVAMLDVGILQRLAKLPVELELKHTALTDMYRGKLAEQFVAQELIAALEEPIYYWSREARSSSAEVDFLVVQDGDIAPVEVKSGKGGSLRSMHLLLKQYPECKKGVVFYDGAFGENKEQRIEFRPLYSVPTLM